MEDQKECRMTKDQLVKMMGEFTKNLSTSEILDTFRANKEVEIEGLAERTKWADSNSRGSGWLLYSSESPEELVSSFREDLSKRIIRLGTTIGGIQDNDARKNVIYLVSDLFLILLTWEAQWSNYQSIYQSYEEKYWASYEECSLGIRRNTVLEEESVQGPGYNRLVLLRICLDEIVSLMQSLKKYECALIEQERNNAAVSSHSFKLATIYVSCLYNHSGQRPRPYHGGVGNGTVAGAGPGLRRYSR